MLRSADLLAIIRRRAGLTQAELAERAGYGRVTVNRWEQGDQQPSLEALERAAAAAGLALSVDVVAADESLEPLVEEQIRRTPLERLRAVLPGDDAAACEQALWWVARARWRVVLVGPVAGVLLGAPERPYDGVVDVVPNSMLRATDELMRAGAAPLEHDGAGELWELAGGGRVRVTAAPPGTHGYRDLARSASTIELPEHGSLPVADVVDLLRIAVSSGEPRDRARRPGLLALLDALAESDERRAA